MSNTISTRSGRILSLTSKESTVDGMKQTNTTVVGTQGTVQAQKTENPGVGTHRNGVAAGNAGGLAAWNLDKFEDGSFSGQAAMYGKAGGALGVEASYDKSTGDWSLNVQGYGVDPTTDQMRTIDLQRSGTRTIAA